MAVHDYIPTTEAERIAWLKRFDTWMQANGASYGFTPAELAEIHTLVTAAETAHENCKVLEITYRAGVQQKKHTLADALTEARADVKRLQAAPNMTDEVRAEAEITVPDETPTTTSADAVEEITPPETVLDWSKRQRVTVHYGLNPHDENHNGKPDGIIGAQIQFHRGGIPEHEADWQILDIDSASPYVHVVHEDVPTSYAYRACWVDTRRNKGPYGDPAVCTVSV